MQCQVPSDQYVAHRYRGCCGCAVCTEVLDPKRKQHLIANQVRKQRTVSESMNHAWSLNYKLYTLNCLKSHL